MQKNKLAFVDYWHHEFTRSGDFLREVLSEKFEIQNFWWTPKKKIPLEEIEKYDYIFFFHIIFPYQIMKRIKSKNILWAPMYDGLIFRNKIQEKIFWKQISDAGVKVLKFSKKVDYSIGNENIESFKLKYYVKCEKKMNESKNNQLNKKIKIFFWDRGQVKLENWINIFNHNDIDEIRYFPLSDPGKKIKEDINKYKDIKFDVINKKFLPKEEYLKLLDDCDVFIAPRLKEGIGMSIVEAISKGMYIVGFNDATMNEYIENNKIGYLFEKNKLFKIKKEDIINNYDYRIKFATLKYDEWKYQKQQIIEFFLRPKSKKKYSLLNLLFIFDDIKFYLKTLLKKNKFIY